MFQMVFRLRILLWMRGPGARWAVDVIEFALFNAAELAIACAVGAFLYVAAREAHQTLMGAIGNAHDRWGGGRYDDLPANPPEGQGGQGLLLDNQEVLDELLDGVDDGQAWEAEDVDP